MGSYVFFPLHSMQRVRKCKSDEDGAEVPPPPPPPALPSQTELGGDAKEPLFSLRSSSHPLSAFCSSSERKEGENGYFWAHRERERRGFYEALAQGVPCFWSCLSSVLNPKKSLVYAKLCHCPGGL